VKLPALSLAILFLAGPAVAAGSLDDAMVALKDAVEKKDPAQVKKLAVETYPMAAQAIAEPAPKDPDEKTAWTSHIEFAKSVQEYCEYALDVIAVQSPVESQVDLFSTLEQLNPKSKYLDQAYVYYLAALEKTGASAKLIPTAEKGLTNLPENVDLLYVLMNSAAAKNPDRALALANRLTAAYNKHPKPESMAAADWEHRKNEGLGRGYYVAGAVYATKGQWLLCDKNLRAALPLIKGNDAMMGQALFYLGMSNYNLGKMTMNKAKILEAAKFSEQSAAIAGAFTEQARHNALVMKDEASKMR
jgi:hypothetical protein